MTLIRHLKPVHLSGGGYIFLSATLATVQIRWNETQVHHKHWEATEHAGDGHVKFSAGDLMKQRALG